MSRHSKNNTASSIFTYGEKQKLKEYGTLKQRIGQDSQRKFEMCHLCLHKVENPRTCEEGHIFCNDCIVEYLVNEKKRLKKLIEEYEDQKKAFDSKKDEESQRNKEKFISDYEKIEKVAQTSKNTPRGINDLTEEEEIINKIKNSQMNTLMTEKSELIRENFWIPETNRKPEEILGDRPSDKILCPASRNHAISYKKIYKAQFCEDTEKNFVCYSCKKEMKFQKVLMGRKCGHVFCKICMEKLCLKEGRCMMCNCPVKKEEVISITEGYTSFIMHNNVEAERYQPAFVETRRKMLGSSKNGLPAYCNASPYKFLNNANPSTNDSVISKNPYHSQSLRSLQETINENFKVVVRVRPPLPREIENGEFISTVQVSSDKKKINIYEYYNIDLVEPQDLPEYMENQNNYTMHQFSFDYVYDQESSQEEVYETTAKPAVMNTLEGFNATIMAYGQTGTGKTYTMEGFKYNNHDPQRGIIPRCIEEIFKYIQNCSDSKTTFMVRTSYLQIYNEYISDLLRTERTNLHIREDKKKGVYVEGLSEWAVRTPNEIYSLMQKGASSRTTAATKMNDVSSRSHAIFIIIVEQMNQTDEDGNQNEVPQQIKVGKLNLVDLAGSERVRVTGATGKRLEECKKINQSLSALGNVIAALTDAKGNRNHVPYRDSKITRILEDSLGGNCKTTFMGMISSSIDAFGESLSSLKFANRAKNIKNAPIINEDVDHKALLRKYESELKKLKTELEQKNKILVDKTRLLQLEEDKKKAEQDKCAAYAALELRSKEFIQEREEKKKLEEKINAMNSQLLIGGRKIEDTPQFRTALEQQQKIIREQYEKKLQDLEKERQIIEEDKAQVGQYKQLLVKQRDIMIALTGRLNERDETIIQLQEELDAYDRIHRETEEALDLKTEQMARMEAFLKERNIQINNLNTKANQNTQDTETVEFSNKDVVHYEDCEMYNITKNNLLTPEQKINKLSMLADTQMKEITRLKDELQSSNQQRKNSFHKTSVSQDFENQIYQIQKQFEVETEKYKEKCQNLEESHQEISEMLKSKDEEIEDLVNKTKTGSQQMESLTELFKSFLHINLDIKKSVDIIIETLSQPNDPFQLQNVAKELLNVQKLVDKSLEPAVQKSFPAPAERNPNINVSNNNNTVNTNSNFAPKVLNERKNAIISKEPIKAKINSENMKFPPNPNPVMKALNNANVKVPRGSSFEKNPINQNQRCKSNENFNNGMLYKAPNFQESCYKYLHK